MLSPNDHGHRIGMISGCSLIMAFALASIALAVWAVS